MRVMEIVKWLLRLTAAIIMLQTLYFKFTAQPESVYIFSTLGMEPWGRLGAGATELVASILLLIPATTWMGALAGAGVMAGAIGSHLTLLGIEVQGDGGQLFLLAVIVFLSCGILLYLHRTEILSFIERYVKRKSH